MKRLTSRARNRLRLIAALFLLSRFSMKSITDRAAAGNLDQARIREIVLETVERVTGKRTDSPTVSEWLERWIRTEKGAVTAGTMIRYEQIT
jgi:hypothetical protein